MEKVTAKNTRKLGKVCAVQMENEKVSRFSLIQVFMKRQDGFARL